MQAVKKMDVFLFNIHKNYITWKQATTNTKIDFNIL